MEKVLIALIFVGGIVKVAKYLFAYLTFCKAQGFDALPDEGGEVVTDDQQ